jgi:hypothetical protein
MCEGINDLSRRGVGGSVELLKGSRNEKAATCKVVVLIIVECSTYN